MLVFTAAAEGGQLEHKAAFMYFLGLGKIYASALKALFDVVDV